jgi:hypothetical protein
LIAYIYFILQKNKSSVFFLTERYFTLVLF